MIVFPAIAAIVALCCAMFVGWDALRRPRPERAIWTVAFLVFAIAAACEVVGAAVGWSSSWRELYYLTGAVLVVGILALGEVYLLLPDHVPAIVPGTCPAGRRVRRDAGLECAHRHGASCRRGVEGDRTWPAVGRPGGGD